MSNSAFQFQFEAIGTHWVIDCFGAPPHLSHESLLAAIKRRTDAFDMRFSRFKQGTMVQEMSRKAGAYKILNSERRLIDLYQTLYYLTSGYVTPLIGQLLSDAGYDESYSLTEKQSLSSVQKWDEILSFKNNFLILKKPALLDFGAAGKGFLVDEISLILKESSIPTFCVDAGGDMYYSSAESVPIEVGLEHPLNNKQVIGVVPLLNSSICGSAGNRRAWGSHHHIMNPHTKKSPTNILGVWVTAASAMLADALATCLFFVEPNIIKQFSFEYLILKEDLTVEKSEEFKAKLYYNNT